MPKIYFSSPLHDPSTFISVYISTPFSAFAVACTRRNQHAPTTHDPRGAPCCPHPAQPITMSTAARRRLMRDFKVCNCQLRSRADLALDSQFSQRMQTDPPAGVSASPIPDNVMTWLVYTLADAAAASPGGSILANLAISQERRDYRARRHTVRGWHISPGDAV